MSVFHLLKLPVNLFVKLFIPLAVILNLLHDLLLKLRELVTVNLGGLQLFILCFNSSELCLKLFDDFCELLDHHAHLLHLLVGVGLTLSKAHVHLLRERSELPFNLASVVKQTADPLAHRVFNLLLQGVSQLIHFLE
jgi:hypothetical protein